MLDKLTEFVDYLIKNKQPYLIELIEDEINFNDPESIRKNYDLILDSVSETIEKYATKTSYFVSHEGGDESIYADGIWTTVLYEIKGWYFWKEPEGQTYGLFPTLEDAIHYAGNL